MELFGVEKKVAKTKWQEIAKVTKNGGSVGIYPVKVLTNDGDIKGIYNAIVGYQSGENILTFDEYRDLESMIAKKIRVSDVSVMGQHTNISHEDFVQGVKKTGSKAIAKITEYYYAELNQKVDSNRLKQVLVTEEGLMGIIGDIIQKVSRKIARDTFTIQYGTYITGEMRVVNKTLTTTHPSRLMYAHTSCIGVEVNDNSIGIAIMYGDDTERGVYGGDTYLVDGFSVDRLPLTQFKEGKYFGEAYKVLLDIAVRAMILASTEGYKEYASKNGMPYYGDTPKYSWLTLKDGSKLTWDNYKLEDIVKLLKA